MSLFFWKKNKHIDIFASTLANELYSLAQPQVAKDYFDTATKDKDARKARKKFGANLQEVIRQVNQFRISHSLGIYGKARLHLKFSERLKELGYDAGTVAKINETVMLGTP